MSSKISIFAKRPFRARSDHHLQRVSSIIRGWQVAEATDAKLNPKTGYKKDVCIYVKPHVKPFEDFKFEGKPYLDIIDGWNLIHLLTKHPEVPVIACSERDKITLAERVSNEVVLIPQHHCNYDRELRTRKRVTTIGCIGTSFAFNFIPEQIRAGIAERKMRLVEFSEFYSREDIIKFYKKIDIQLVWRPYSKTLANPLKLVNGASFGVPSIVLDEPYFKEMGSSYVAVRSIRDFFVQLDRLRSQPALYRAYSQLSLEKAERYHIDNIAKLYQALG